MSESPCELRILHPGSESLDALPDSHEIVLAEEGILSAAVAGKNTNGLLMSGRRHVSQGINLTPITMTTDTITFSGGTLHHPVLATSVVQQSNTINTSLVASSLAACVPSIIRNEQSVTSVLQSPLMSGEPQTCRLEASDLVGCRVTTELRSPCPTPMSCPSLSLSECDVEHATDDLSTAPSLEDDTSEGVIVIAGEPSSDDGDGILEIGVGDTLSHHNLQDPSPSSSPSPPPYKLLSQPTSSFPASLSLPSSSIKDEMDGQDISDDLDESMHSIHQSPLHHLNIGSLSVMRVKDGLHIKELKDEASLDA
ncbi:hypothetical protein FHG87_008319 [Trinorchestia longiramus]|nr:hypothetical protein FHG87_008319 [Trinorchestia longiramus]